MGNRDKKIGDTYEEEYIENGEMKTRNVIVTDKYTDEDDNIHIITEEVTQ